MYGSHNIQWIRPYHWQRPHLATDKWPDPATYTKSGVALPGAGNFLIFDNGCYNTSPNIGSRILEINPRIGASGVEEVPKGQYIWPVDAGYKTQRATTSAGSASSASGATSPAGRRASTAAISRAASVCPTAIPRSCPGTRAMLRGDAGAARWCGNTSIPRPPCPGRLRSKPLRATATMPGRWTTPTHQGRASPFSGITGMGRITRPSPAKI